MEDDAELLLERVEEEMAEDYSEEEDGYNQLMIIMMMIIMMMMIVKMMVGRKWSRTTQRRMTSTITPPLCKAQQPRSDLFLPTRDVLHIDELGAFPGSTLLCNISLLNISLLGGQLTIPQTLLCNISLLNNSSSLTSNYFPGNERTGSGTKIQHERPEPYLQSRFF